MKTIFKNFSKYVIAIIFINIILCFCTFIPQNTFVCYAENASYYYINQNTLLTPTNQNIKGNIQLNNTYYVKSTGNPDVVINEITYKIVQYNGIEGMVVKSSLSNKSITNVSIPYFVSPSLITVKATDEDVLMFFNIVDNETQCIKLKNDTKLNFIAYSEDGKYILAKKADSDIYGFVQKKYCEPTIIYTPHPNPINPDETSDLPTLKPDSQSQQQQPAKANVTRTILIVILCVVVVIVIFLLFKPVKTKSKKKHYDDFYEI